MTTPNSSPTVPDVPERVHVAFSSEVAPIRDVTVFCENKAEITRNVNFSSPSKLGRHEVSEQECHDILRHRSLDRVMVLACAAVQLPTL